MSEKAKVDKPDKPKVNRYGFLVLWVAAQVLGWLGFLLLALSGVLEGLGSIFTDNTWLLGILLGICVGVPTAIFQKIALYLGFGRWFQGWIRANILAWLLGSLGLAALMAADANSMNGFLPPLVILMFPAFAQAWIFRRYFERAWLWLLSTGAASMVLTAFLNQMSNPDTENNFLIFPAFGLFATVTGLTLIWLFGMQASENQSKNIADTSRLEDGAEEESADSVELGETVQRKVV